MGNKIWRLGIFDAVHSLGVHKLVHPEGVHSVALAVKVEAKRGIFLLIQHGPIIQNSKFKNSEILLTKLQEIAKEEKCDFIRVATLLEMSEENKKMFKDFGFREAPMHASAYEATWKLDITASEDELLANMRKTTRYLIRQAQKNPDITIEKSPAFVPLSGTTAGKDKIEIYQRLNREVAKKQNFTPFSDEYIKNEFEVFAGDGQALWLFGRYKGELAAGVLVIFWSGIGFYHQAASLAKYAKFSIPYLLQWEAIREAKNRGCRLYDFWGYVDPQEQPKHPWAGPTLFKMGFGGRAYEYIKTQDLPLSKKYWLTYIFEKLRKIRRGL